MTMYCSRLFIRSQIDKLTLSVSVGLTSKLFSDSVKEKVRVNYLFKFTENEKQLVLDHLNKCMVQPISIKIGQKQLKSIQKFIEENNSFTDIPQLYELNGFEPETADRMCRKILKSLNPSKNSNSSSSSYITPTISPLKKQEIKTIVGIDVGTSCVSWSKLDCSENSISKWQMIEMLPAQEVKSIVNIYTYVLDFIREIPTSDVYIMESKNWSLLNPQMSLRNHLRDAQITAMLTALLNSGYTSNVQAPGENSVYFLRPLSPSRLFSTLIGSERVSSQHLVEKMFEGEFPEYCTMFNMNSASKGYYFSLDKSMREDMCQSLLITLTCRELVLHNKSLKLKTVKGK